jgi:CheY-like chemotaxis protein
MGRQMARVVVVEDEIQVLMLAESVLQQVGHETMDARTVAEGQAKTVSTCFSVRSCLTTIVPLHSIFRRRERFS